MTAPSTLEVTECKQLLDRLLHPEGTDYSTRKSFRNYLLGLLMLETGLRVGEVVGLHVTDLWWAEAPVTTLVVRADLAKGGQERQIPISTKLADAITECHEQLPSLFAGGYSFVFDRCGSHDKHITTRTAERIISTAAQDVLGRPVHPHVLRHTFASRLLRKTNIRVVQELLGHKHLSSTQIYTHPNGDDLRRAIDAPDK